MSKTLIKDGQHDSKIRSSLWLTAVTILLTINRSESVFSQKV